MNVLETSLPGVKILDPKVFGDNRGYFYESYNKNLFDNALGREIVFLQDNHSMSKKGVLRGLHYQEEPYGQGKLIRVAIGAVYDVAVDVRKKSPTYGKWCGQILSAENKLQMWIPEGFAHGFLVLSEKAEFLYKTTNYWHPEAEKTVQWDDPTINIQWPLNGIEPILSEKDRHAPPLQGIAN